MKLSKKEKPAPKKVSPKVNPMYDEYVKGVSISAIAEKHRVDVSEVLSVVEGIESKRK